MVVVKITSHDFGTLETLHPVKHDPTEVGFNKYQNPLHYNILKQIDITKWRKRRKHDGQTYLCAIHLCAALYWKPQLPISMN